MSVLLADIGGTHARFAIMKSGKMSDIYQYRCADFKNAYCAIQSFLGMCEQQPDFAVIGMAGSVVNGNGHWTNLPWQLSESKLKQKFGFKKVKLFNDLIPQGYALNFLKPKDVVKMTNIAPQKKGLKVLMSIGTGLGCCLIIEDNIYPSEYGQTLLPCGDVLESQVSGRGIKFAYTKETGKKLSAYTIETHMDQGQKNAEKAYAAFYDALARAVQNMALITQPIGGLYLAGGMLSGASMRKANFIHHVQSHPKMGTLLKGIPVCLVTNKELAFIGLSKIAKKYGWT